MGFDSSWFYFRTPLASFAARLIHWQKHCGRHHLPWQNTRDPYRIWLAEIMLQQTQVDTVRAYYERFLHNFPKLEALAQAPIERVLELWAGLGYYRRAHNLHACAQAVVAAGSFPDTQAGLMTLPGIGRSTAAAIAVFAFGQRAAIMDGNVRRVLSRHHGLDPDLPAREADKKLWQLAGQLLPTDDLVAYTQGLMDLGSQVCTPVSPRCLSCPLAADCKARTQQRSVQLPAAQAPQKIVERAFCMVVLKRGDQLLFVARDKEQIWGGLWSFPECELPDGVERDLYLRQWVATRYGLTAGALEWRPRFSHRLTHRKLLITPVIVEVEGELQSQETCRFLTREAAEKSAIPTAVKKILTQ